MFKVELSSEVDARLARAAEASGRSPTDLVNEAVAAMLDDLEDVAAAELALDEIAAGRSRTYTLDEVERELGLADRVR